MRQQLTRLFIVFALLVAALGLARRFLVPPTFGELGHYRAAAVEAVAGRKVEYAGRLACVPCHEDLAKQHEAHRHRGVSCEVCHGPAAGHTADPTEKRPSAPRQRGQCPLCHGYNPSRPTGFPQIEVVSHNPLKPCISCHNPHAPGTPRAPEECGACHGEIARTKAVSSHALLPCTRCHETNSQHRVSPQLSQPSKPTVRAFCGECHARGAAGSKDIPRVDLASHGNGNICWQCHYPHHPEAK